MSQSIILSGSTKRLALTNGQALRQPVYGSSWTKVRIGLRLCFPAVSALGGSPQMVIGMCSGITGFAEATTANFVGVRTVTPSWFFSGTPGVNGVFGSMDMKACTRVGSTTTNHASVLGGSTGANVSAEGLIRSAWILQIEKGSPNYTVRVVIPGSGGAAATDINDSLWTQLMELDDALTTPSTIVANYFTKETNNTIAASEVAGALDHLYFFWDKTSVPCYVDDVSHRLIA